jgi:hypothetical protein
MKPVEEMSVSDSPKTTLGRARLAHFPTGHLLLWPDKVSEFAGSANKAFEISEFSASGAAIGAPRQRSWPACQRL